MSKDADQEGSGHLRQYHDLIARAAADPQHIVLAEGSDQRVVNAAVRAITEGVADITLLGDARQVRALTKAAGDDEQKIQIVEPKISSEFSEYADLYRALRKDRDIDHSAADEAVLNPLNFANLMVRAGHADGSLAGAAHSSADVVRSALNIIGQDTHFELVSSFFLMLLDENFHKREGGMAFADCGLVIEPDARQLGHIAAATADSAKALLGVAPKVALLSFATRGSADHPSVNKMVEAGKIFRKLRPEIPVEAAIQFDAAFVPEVAAIKAPGSEAAGHANVFIFPDLNSGNIAYKIAERVGRVKALGPILQGLSRPANDLSRGCDCDAIYAMIAVTAVQSQMMKGR